jgi:hypothetical protein
MKSALQAREIDRKSRLKHWGWLRMTEPSSQPASALRLIGDDITVWLLTGTHIPAINRGGYRIRITPDYRGAVRNLEIGGTTQQICSRFMIFERSFKGLFESSFLIASVPFFSLSFK